MTPPADRIAAEFCRQMRAALTANQMTMVRERNRTPAYTFSCATHDFCDANMVMDAAFTAALGRDFDHTSESDMETFNAAWDAAKAAEFRESRAQLTAWQKNNTTISPQQAADQLTQMLETFATEHGVRHACAFEMLNDGPTPEQGKWLHDFIRTWEAYAEPGA